MQFAVFSNEIVDHIFDYLTVDDDVLRVFAHRYDDLIRFHIKQIDLTDNWRSIIHSFNLLRSVDCSFS